MSKRRREMQKKGENYARKKTEQVRFALGDPKDDEVAPAIPASGSCCL